MNPVTLALQLIDIPSITGAEAALAIEIEAICVQQGWSVHREYIEENRWNLYVNWDDFAPVVFCTHLDTVPPWFPSGNDGEYLHGRGACDTKGIMAGMLSAGLELKSRGITPSYLFVVGEETASEGAKFSGKSGRKAKYIIVGEPTENKLAAGHKGALSYTLRTKGVAAHSSLPEKGESAIAKLLPILRSIEEIPWPCHPVLGATTTSITGIGGGTAINIIPEAAWAKVFHRITVPLAAAKEAVEQCVGDRGTLEFHSMTNPQELVVVDGYPSTVVAFGTDIPYLRELGLPLLLGPGSIEDAHTMTERISIRQLEESVELYVNLYLDLCGVRHE